MIGTTLAHYEVLAAIGRGGMGEVWRARDTTLGREVAIKTLPPQFANDPDRLARFEREARLLATLNHPHIATIYGLERVGDTRFLVLELIEGDTLADRISRGAIPVEEALRLALQMAQALEAAHEKGVVHRDLKPGNIKVTADGKVKVLDFGLAKALAGDEPSVNVSNSPTLTAAATRQGLILGTAGYMSPEQARGRATDKRADIWAFGCVLFECLTGRAAFSGEDVSDILASVLKSEPDSGTLPANLNPRVRELLHRCLQKDPQQRYRDIGDVRMEIDSLLADPTRLLVRSADLAGGRSSKLPWVAGIALAILSGASAWYLKPAPLAAPRTVTRFVHELPRNVALNTGQPVIAVSRSGDELVYATREGLYLRRMNELEARRIPGTEKEDTGDPFFSPNGEWIGYVSLRSGQLKKVRATGGEPVFLADVGVSGFSPFWTADGWIVYVQQPRIMRVSENGGEATVLVDVKDRVVGPILLPDGDSLLFTIGAGNRRKVAVRSLATGNQTTLFDDADSGVQFVSSGHLVYGSGNAVSARAFDVRTRAVGSRVPLVQSFFRLSVDSGPQFKVSESGTLVYLPGSETRRSAGIPTSLAIVDRRGRAEVLPAEIRNYLHPRFSPDDRRIAVQITDDRGPNIWIYDIENNVLNQLTFDGGGVPIWSPDGKEVTFVKDSALWTVRSDSSGTPMLLAGTKVTNNTGPGSWSPDGTVLLFVSDAGIHAWTPKNAADTASVIVQSGQQGFPVLPEFSPDGRWFTYMVVGGSGPELYASPYPVGSGGRQRLTSSDAGVSTWIRKRSEIVFLSSANPQGARRSAPPSEFAVLSLPITTGPTLTRRNPVELFRFTRFDRLFAPPPGMRSYDVSQDGERFVVPIRQNPAGATDAPGEDSVRLNVVLNWTEELKRLVPTLPIYDAGARLSTK